MSLEGFMPPSKALVSHGGVPIELARYLMGCHINENSEGLNEEEAIVYRGMSQSYYNSREFSLVSQSLSEYNCGISNMTCLPTTMRTHNLPSVFNDAKGASMMPFGDPNECQLWVQPGEFKWSQGAADKVV